ncbi:MAG: hypothetical protein IJ083_03910 [Clostridia bacterium]|nr:hypothetical protein [Clostridia bacterium]
MKQRIIRRCTFLFAFCFCFLLLSSHALGEKAFSFLGGGMPSTGAVQAMVVRLELEGSYGPGWEEGELRRLFDGGEGYVPESMHRVYPYESIHAYYDRSSFGKLSLSLGQVMTVSVPFSREDLEGQMSGGDTEQALLQSVIREIERKITDEQMDLTRFDSDGDGRMDALFLLYPGEDESWSSLLWPHCRNLEEDAAAFGSLLVQRYVMIGTAPAATWIHEIGHLLGLPDLYGFETGGLRGDQEDLNTSDMMRDNTGDHNAVSKYFLGWLEGQVRVMETGEMSEGEDILVDMSPMNESGDGTKLLILSNGFSGPGGEYLAVEYVTHAGNMAVDAMKSGEGAYRIFHVNALLDAEEQGFLYDDNMGDEHQLIQALRKGDAHALFSGDDVVAWDTEPSTALSGGRYFGYTGWRLESFLGGEHPCVTVSHQAKVRASSSVTLRGTTEDLPPTLNLILEADEKLLLSAGHGEGAFLRETEEDMICPVLVTVEGRRVLVEYTQLHRPLTPGGEYELIFPEGFFTLDEDVTSAEIILSVQMGYDAMPLLAVTDTFLGDAWQGKSRMAVQGDCAVYVLLGADEEGGMTLCLVTVNREGIIHRTEPVPLRLPDSIDADALDEPVLCAMDNGGFCVGLSDEMSTFLVCLSEDGEILGDGATVPDVIHPFALGDLIKGKGKSRDGDIGVMWTVDFSDDKAKVSWNTYQTIRDEEDVSQLQDGRWAIQDLVRAEGDWQEAMAVYDSEDTLVDTVPLQLGRDTYVIRSGFFEGAQGDRLLTLAVRFNMETAREEALAAELNGQGEIMYLSALPLQPVDPGLMMRSRWAVSRERTYLLAVAEWEGLYGTENQMLLMEMDAGMQVIGISRLPDQSDVCLIGDTCVVLWDTEDCRGLWMME